MKILIRLRECTALSGLSLSAYTPRYVFAWQGSDKDPNSVNVSGWSGCAKVSCSLRHRVVRLRLAYSWARPTILAAGKGRGGRFYFFSFSTFIFPISSLFFSCISSTISSISPLPFSCKRHKMANKGWRVIKPQHNRNRTCMSSKDSGLSAHSQSDQNLHCAYLAS